MGDFEQETRVEGEEGRYRAELSPAWAIWGPNGGYLATIAMRAAGREARIPRPVSFAGHFLAVGRFAPVEVRVTPLRLGRRSESLRVEVVQEGRPLFEGMLRTAAEGEGLEHEARARLEVPPPESLPAPDPSRTHTFWKNFDRRWVKPADRSEEPRAYEPHGISWQRFRPRATFADPFVDAGRSLLLVDTLTWPAASLPHPNPRFRAPNLDVTVWFHRSAPQSEWLLVEQVSRLAGGGLMATEGRVYDREGRLLASGGAQLFCVPERE